jgi:site-specific DNA-methyltransferase (cytosine-N4-specific)
MVVTTTHQITPDARLHVGDARAVLATMADESVNCIVTSPPYWAKRDYGVSGQYGHEPGPEAYIATLRSVFREARRVLAADGTCWLNLGDSYSAGSGTPSGLHTYIGAGLTGRHTPGMGTKNLLGLPWRTALALQDDGWILRNAIIWHKPNAMPESVRDRLNCRHEMIFLLVKSRHYWFDLDPIRIPHATPHAGQAAAGRTSTRRPPRTRPAIAGRAARPGRPSTARTPGRSLPPGGTAMTGGMPPTHAAAIPATSGPSPPAPTAGRTSPHSRSTSRCAASRPAARQAAWSSTRSAAPAPPASPP